MIQQTTNELQLLIKAVGYLMTHWWLIALEILCVFSFGFYIFHRTPQVFESHAALLIDSSRRQIYQQVMTPGNPYNNLARRQNMANLFTSNDTLERTKARLFDIYEKRGSSNHLDFFFPGGKPMPGGNSAVLHLIRLGPKQRHL